jgi:hypothetical protein
MSTLRNILRVATLCAIACSAACGGDDEPGSGGGLLDASIDGGDAGTVGDGSTPNAPGADALYVVSTSIQTGQTTSSLYAWPTKQFENVKFDLKDAREFAGSSELVPYNGYVYIPNSEKSTITRFEIQNDKLVEGPVMGLSGRGLGFVSYTYTILSPTRAFLVSAEQYKIVEWNPTTMTITKSHDIAALKKEGWAAEYRGGFVRDDGKFIFYWTYTNQRADFLNTFVIGVFDTATDTLTIEEDPTCPASAGFGGFFDEQGDLYLIADSFGGYTQWGGYKDAKPTCIVRVKKGETKLDPTFKLHPSTAMDGQVPFGLYYAGSGVVFTTGIDPAITSKYNSTFEILFAPEHVGWLIDLKAGTGRKLEGLPKDGVSFETLKRTDNRLFVPRTSGQVAIEDIKSTDSTLWEVKSDGTTQKILSLPGMISVSRVR